MKVLHVIPSISSLRGGPSVAALEMTAALRDTGVDVAIATTNDDGPLIDANMPIGQWFDRCGVPVIAFPRWSPPVSPLREFAISTGLTQWLIHHIADYDLLHIHALFSWASTSTMALARRVGIPYVISTIGQLNHWSLAQRAGRKRLFLALIERRNLSHAAALHFTTEAERQQASSLNLPTHNWIIPLGVHIPASPSPPSYRSGSCDISKVTSFLFLSRIHPKKQLENLITALSLLQQRSPTASWQLLIAGDGDPNYLLDLRHQVDRLGIGHRCHWLGFLDGFAKWEALRQADWFVLPSASENFGIAAIEALAAGTPPILSPDVAVADDISASGAGLISSADPLALSFVLEDALAGPPAEMRSAASQLAATRFSWQSIASEFDRAYHTVFNSSYHP